MLHAASVARQIDKRSVPTAVFEVLATNNVAALRKEKLRHKTILHIDPVGEALYCLLVPGVDLRKGSGTDMAGKDDVERRDALAVGMRFRESGHLKGAQREEGWEGERVGLEVRVE